MARGKKKSSNGSAFAGPDAEKEAIEKLAESAAKSNKGHNSGEIDEEVERRNTLQIKAALQDLNLAMSEAASKRGVLGSFKKLAKKEGCDVDAIMYALKLEARSKTGGSSAIVSEHRAVGRILKHLDCPLGTQFKLFDLDDDRPATAAAPKDEAALIREATLEGEHAGLNGEPKENNPYFNRPGTAPWFGWNNGWQVGADKLTDSFKTGARPVHSSEQASPL